MISVIGHQRVALILLLACFAAGAFFYTNYVLIPDVEKAQLELNRNNAEINEKTEEMNKLVQGIEQFQADQAIFRMVKKRGFFDPQDRLEMRTRLNLLQEQTNVSATYTIKPAVTEKSKSVEDAGYKILNTDVEFKLEALLDQDIYRFVHMVNYGFPGQIIIKNFLVSRDAEITQPFLRQIGTGSEEPTVRATLNLNWRTMVPNDEVDNEEADDSLDSGTEGY